MEIKPFRAYRFDEAVVGDAGKCIAPPYDVIDSYQQEQLYEKSQYNIVRIIKGKTGSSDSDSNNQYSRAAQYLSDWIEHGVLKPDSDETIYAYVQDFVLSERRIQRFSFIALGRLEEFGATVRPHEKTLKGPIIDRLNLNRATSAKFGLVFMLYEDKQSVADRIIEDAKNGKALIDFVDEEDARHRIFAITEPDKVEAIVEMMSQKNCIIADGHHRYTTGLAYACENPNSAAQYQMIAFANTCNEGLVILPTHRLVTNLRDFDAKGFIAQLENNFAVTPYNFDSDVTKRRAEQEVFIEMKVHYDKGDNAFGIYCGDNAFYLAVLKDSTAMDCTAPGMSQGWKSLDVSVLHKLILEKMLGIGEKQLAEATNVRYVKDTGNAVECSIEEVDAGRCQLAAFMNPTKMRQIQMVTDARETMPQKSTFFYPKVFTGLTINKLQPG